MNQKQKLKQFREDWKEIDSYLYDNKLNDFDQIKDGKFFNCNIASWRRKRCSVCNKLVNLGKYYVFPRYSFFGYYSRSNIIHLDCFVKEIRNDLSKIENFAKYMEFNLNGKDFGFSEVEN